MIPCIDNKFSKGDPVLSKHFPAMWMRITKVNLFGHYECCFGNTTNFAGVFHQNQLINHTGAV